LTANE
jgi:hypothetical protein